MKPEYYFYCCRIDEKDLYLIWFSNENDGTYVDIDGKIPVFENLDNAKKYAESQNISANDEDLAFINLDKMKALLFQENFKLNCDEFNNVWNLFKDVSHSVNGEFDSDKKKTNKIYDKLFWGLNLPSVTPENKSYEPIWSKEELQTIREVLLKGFLIFQENIKIIG